MNLFSLGELLTALASRVSWSEYRAAVQESGITAAHESNALKFYSVFSSRRHLLDRFKQSALLQLVGFAKFLDGLSEPEIARLSSLSVRQLSAELRNHPRTLIPADSVREAKKLAVRQENLASRNAKRLAKIEALSVELMPHASSQRTKTVSA